MTEPRTYSLLHPGLPKDLKLPPNFFTGVDLSTSKSQCITFNDLLGGGPARKIGYIVWDRVARAWCGRVFADATRDDMIVMVDALRGWQRSNPNGPLPDDRLANAFDCFDGKTDIAEVARRLSDYGDDLHLVAKIPESVAELAPSTSVLEGLARETTNATI